MLALRNLRLNEKIFLAAGLATLFAVPFLGIGGFYLWLAVKIVYAVGIILLILRR